MLIFVCIPVYFIFQFHCICYRPITRRSRHDALKTKFGQWHANSSSSRVLGMKSAGYRFWSAFAKWNLVQYSVSCSRTGQNAQSTRNRSINKATGLGVYWFTRLLIAQCTVKKLTEVYPENTKYIHGILLPIINIYYKWNKNN